MRHRLLMLFAIVLCATGYGQTAKTVTGTVFDENNAPLPGVNVLIQGKSSGTTTNFDGEYSINVEDLDILVFSYIGFLSSNVPVEGKTTIDVTMQIDSQQLDEVVVVGFGTQSRSLVTSSISKVQIDQVKDNPSINAVQSLQGKVAGLSILPTSGQPGEAATVFIRGGTQPDGNSGNNSPLYIVDGVFRNNLEGLNSNDIESIQVLKDAASTSIYGARAANGVILVTTKSGERNSDGQLTVNYRSGIAQQISQYPFTSAEDYIRVSRIAAAKGINLESPGARLDNDGRGYSTQRITERGQYGFTRNTLTFLDDLIGVEGQAYVADLLENQDYQTMVDPVTQRTLIFKDNNYNDVLFTPALLTDLTIGASGGSETGNYNISLGYVDQEGTVLGTGFTRFTGLFNGNFDVNPNLTLNGGVNFSYQEDDSVVNDNNTINRSSRMPHTLRLFNDDGTPALGETTGSPRNIFHELFYRENDRKRYLTTLNLGANWRIFEGFSFEPSVSFFRDDRTLNFFERASPEIPQRRSQRDEFGFNQLLLNGVFKYRKSFGDNNFNFLWGINYTKERTEFISGDGSNAPTDIISTLNASATEFERVTSNIVENKLFSHFGRISYDYQGKYLLEASYRNDGASQFAADNKFAFFPSASAGWNIHREEFWKLETINRIKLRGSWGQVGSLAGLAIQNTQGEFGTRSYNFQGGATLSGLSNTGLKWETTSTLDIGLDLGFFNNRINLLLDFYRKLTEDRLVNRLIPQQTGFNSIRDNFGSLSNTGFEIELGADIIRTENFTWHTDFNFAYNETLVEELPENERDKNRVQGGVVYNPDGGEIEVGGLAEGERPFGIWGYDMIGVYATDADAANAPVDLLVSGSKVGDPKNGGDAIWRDVNNDNIIDEKDLVFIGYETPNIIGGLVNNFNYKGFNIRIAMDYALGHVINNGWKARANGNARNNVMTITDVLQDNFWQNQGDIATYPRYDNASDFDNGYRNHIRGTFGVNSNIGNRVGGGTSNTLYFKDGDFLAFREVSLSYAFPLKDMKMDRLGLSGLNLSLNAYNLGYLTKYDGLTPEIYDIVDEGIYPRPFQLIVGLNVTF